jgi:hypothetical protein
MKKMAANPAADRGRFAELEQLANIGLAMAALLRRLGVSRPGELRGRGPARCTTTSAI